MAQHDTSVWFITGCSTGFGREKEALTFLNILCHPDTIQRWKSDYV